ncbi:putative Actin [Trypanosoma vivax]|uniref:Putative actin-like protein n=1 Tax=Trypanosoma vivax (strain Y486) TaxID=1055687 RepID=G0UCQ0_TRYVY|nr:putative actin-like protein [Trypanosoma vivax]KAH8607994.1 putative Actin [Trypanosoma vivax]CCC53610.1 putative actin-like protein [Trypanosoma vivax Y486]
MAQHNPVAVLDVGSRLTRVGFGGEEAPRVVSSTVVGTPKQRGLVGSLLQHYSDDYAGDAACAREGLLNLCYPVQNRRIVNFSALEHALQDILYQQLPLVPCDTPLLWVEAACTSRIDRERLSELLFESFDVPLLGTVGAPTTTAYSTGRTSGLVLDSGEGCTTFSAVWEGYSLQYAVHVSPLAGGVLTDKLLSFLRAKGYPFSTSRDRRLAEEVKHSLCYVAADVEREMEEMNKKLKPEYYGLPDDQHIYLNEGQFMIPELLFNPLLCDADCHLGGEAAAEAGTPSGDVNSLVRASISVASDRDNWADTVVKVVQAAPVFTHQRLFENVVLGGGNTLFPGIEQRLQRELVLRRTSTEQKVNCIAFADRDLAAWIGGSVVASMSTFPQMCLSRKDYLESGPSIVHTKV